MHESELGGQMTLCSSFPLELMFSSKRSYNVSGEIYPLTKSESSHLSKRAWNILICSMQTSCHLVGNGQPALWMYGGSIAYRVKKKKHKRLRDLVSPYKA